MITKTYTQNGAEPFWQVQTAWSRSHQIRAEQYRRVMMRPKMHSIDFIDGALWYLCDTRGWVMHP